MTKINAHPTLSQVARKAGVGTTTVSRVINGGDRVSPETLAHVRRVIETLGYMPSQAARTLKGHRTKTIGLVIPSIAEGPAVRPGSQTKALQLSSQTFALNLLGLNDPCPAEQTRTQRKRATPSGIALPTTKII